ncbi:MAG: protein prkA, partial [Anaerolineae bacterium]
EGMEGISPRFVINQISNAVAKGDLSCLDPLSLLQIMWAGIEQSTTLAQEERDGLSKLFADTRREYEAMALKEVQKAFIDAFDEAANSLAREYFRQIEAHCTKQGLKDPETGLERDPDENFMRSLERSIGVQDYEKSNFRWAIYERLRPFVQRGIEITYTLDGRLQAAVEKEVLPDTREVRQVLAPRDSLGVATARRDEVIERLVRQRGYCQDGALRLVDYVARSLSQSERDRARRVPKALQWLWR